MYVRTFLCGLDATRSEKKGKSNKANQISHNRLSKYLPYIISLIYRYIVSLATLPYSTYIIHHMPNMNK